METMTRDRSQKAKNTYNDNITNVVIRTLKERCCLLQRRLRAVEEENIRLSKHCTKLNDKPSPDNQSNNLKTSLAELSKENALLTQRVLMVAFENKNLWTRLSALTGTDNGKVENNLNQPDVEIINDNKITTPQLIRSQTFTQTTPNPKLIAKLEEKDVDLDMSLEEISLKILNSFIMEKSELVLQCEEMVELQKTSNFDVNTVGFTYLGDENNYDSVAHIKQYTDKLIDLKNIAMQQQADLKTYIKNMEAKKQEEKYASPHVAKNSSDISKEIAGIDSPETEVLDSSTRWVTPANSTSYHDNIDDSSCSQNTSKILNNVQTNSKTSSKVKGEGDNFTEIPKKKNSGRTCPMCAKKFESTTSFEVFQEHVESHFIADDYNSLDDENLVLSIQ